MQLPFVHTLPGWARLSASPTVLGVDEDVDADAATLIVLRRAGTLAILAGKPGAAHLAARAAVARVDAGVRARAAAYQLPARALARPPLQVWPVAHALPQVPQLFMSDEVLTHVPLQLVCPVRHAQVPPTRLAAGAHHAASAAIVRVVEGVGALPAARRKTPGAHAGSAEARRRAAARVPTGAAIQRVAF